MLLTALLAQSALALDVQAERFVRLALELGEYDKDYVDAYLGPDVWREEARKNLRPKETLAAEIDDLMGELRAMAPGDPETAQRLDQLYKNVRAMDARVRMTAGERFSFAEEARRIYDVTLPEYSFDHFDQVLARLEERVPGEGALADRFEVFHAQFDLSPERIGSVIDQAITECRQRTVRHIDLPETESYTLEYVTDKSWGGYNWYQGDNHSLVQVNLDFPVKIDRAIGLGCHEGYPGHHVWNVLVENHLLNERGWVEYSLFPLFSPGALIAEGSANYGVELAFPGDEKIEYERDVLFPLAGLDPALAGILDELNELTRQLRFATIATAQLYLDGEIDREQAIEQRRKYGLSSREKAEQSVRFIEQYRSYVLNYSLGRDLVQSHVEQQADDEAGRWATFERLLIEMPSASEMVSSP
jgi:hypothetical protein